MLVQFNVLVRKYLHLVENACTRAQEAGPMGEGETRKKLLGDSLKTAAEQVQGDHLIGLSRVCPITCNSQ